MLVKNRVKRPHEYILVGPNKERVSYNNQLTVVQWVAGFCRTMWEEHRHGVRDHMLDYMIALLHDAQHFSGEVVSWAKTKKLTKLKE